jgi:hypothetical protein
MSLTESQHLGRKSAKIALRQLAETVFAFSNGEAAD